MIRAGLIFGAAAGLAGLGAGQWIVNLLFGTRYLEAGYLLGPVMWLPIPFICATTMNRLYFARGEFFIPTVCSGVGALVMTLIMPWLVAAMDTLGAVLATATGMLVWALSLIFLLAKSGDLDVRQAIFRPLALIFFALGVFLLFKSVNVWLALLTSWVALLCGTLQFGGVTEEERSLFKLLKQRWSSLDVPGSNQPGA
jgi:O-antigen/teichoic acid export membrane protein